MVDTGTGPINHPPRQRAGVAAQDRTDPWHIESFDWSRFDSIVHRSPWSGRSICLEAKRTDRQAGIAQPQVVDPQVQLTAPSPTWSDLAGGTFRWRPPAPGRPRPTSTTTARRPVPRRSRLRNVKPAKPAEDCGGHPATGTPSPFPSNSATNNGTRAHQYTHDVADRSPHPWRTRLRRG